MVGIDLNPTDLLEKGFLHFMGDVADQAVQLDVKMLQQFFIDPVHLDKMTGYSTFSGWLIAVSFLFLGAVVAKEFFMNLLEESGDMAMPPLVILKNTFVAGGLIVLSPVLITGIIFPLIHFTDDVITAIFGSPHTLSLQLPKQLNINNQDTLMSVLASPIFVAAYAVFISIAMLSMLLSAGVRWAELVLLALVGPVLAVTKANFNTAWDIWLRETIAVSLSQVVQYLGIMMALDFMFHAKEIDAVSGTTIDPYYRLFILAGIVIFALKGPSTLRSFIIPSYSNGMKALSGLRGAIGK